MSLIITKKSKRAKAQDAVARNAASDELNVGDKIWITQYGRNYPYTITKKWKEGWTVWYKVKNDKSGKEEIVAGAFANALGAAAQDAQDAQGDEVIAQKNGYKLVHNTLNDGYWFYTKSGAGWGITATNKVAAINEFNRLVGSAKDAAELNNDADLRAADAQFKVGDRVKVDAKYSSNVNGGVGIVSDIKNGDVVVEFTGHGKVRVPALYVQSADSSFAADAGDAAEKGSRELQNVFYGALYALKKVADRAKVEGAQTLVDAANSAAKELTSKSYTVF